MMGQMVKTIHLGVVLYVEIHIVVVCITYFGTVRCGCGRRAKKGVD